MESRTIPAEQWAEFLDRFSRDHVGWSTTIEVLDDRAGPQRVAADLPLQGIALETAGTRPCTIEIGSGDEPDRHVTHLVDMPLHIRELEQGAGSVDLQIEPANGPVTLVHLRGPVQ